MLSSVLGAHWILEFSSPPGERRAWGSRTGLREHERVHVPKLSPDPNEDNGCTDQNRLTDPDGEIEGE